MKGRLFWKALVGFWLTFAVISFGVARLLSVLQSQTSLTDEQVAHRLAPPILQLCADAVAAAGPVACSDRLGRLAPDDRSRVQIRLLDAAASDDRRPSLKRQAVAPGGARYEIAYHYAAPPPWPSTILKVPFEVLLMGAVGGLTYGAVLAWYVIAPIRRVRRGFEELSRGRLDVRVGHTVGGRSDELADLARDFDSMAAQLETLVDARDRLLHDVSHEIRSPLSRLQHSIALARQDAGRLPASLDRIEHEAQRLNGLVDELLTLARVESGVAGADEYFDLGGVVRSVISDAEFEAGAVKVPIRTNLAEVAEDLPTIRGSSELIRRAVENVVRNAIRFSPPGQPVTLDLRFDPHQQSYRLVVADSGPGVAEAALARLFDPFVKGGDSKSSFGLGLSIAYRAVQAHGGRIVAANRDPSGLLVTITHPAHAPSESKLPAHEVA